MIQRAASFFINRFDLGPVASTQQRPSRDALSPGRYCPTRFRHAAAALLLAAQAGGGWAIASETPVEVTLSTTAGDIVLELDQKLAPDTVANFLQYVDDDFYDGTIFHRVIEGFMIQGGGFSGSYERKETRAPIRNEANNGLSNRRYSISMARTNAPHSATAQFFINTVDNNALDHTGPTPRGWGYAVFGRVVKGHDVVDAISQVATGPGGPFPRDAPRELVVINTVERASAETAATETGNSESQ